MAPQSEPLARGSRGNLRGGARRRPDGGGITPRGGGIPEHGSRFDAGREARSAYAPSFYQRVLEVRSRDSQLPGLPRSGPRRGTSVGWRLLPCCVRPISRYAIALILCL